MKLGLPITELPDVSIEQARKDAQFSESILAKLETISVEELTHQEWLSLELLRWQAEMTVEALPYYWLNFPVTPYSSPLGSVRQVFTTYTFESRDDLDNYLSLLEQFPALVADMQAKLERQAEEGIRLPVEEIGLVVPFLKSFHTDSAKSPFYVEAKRLEGLDQTLVEEFQARLEETIRDGVNPAIEQTVVYVSEEYRERAPDRVGLHQYPEGKDYYRFLVRYHTTMDVTPEEIHQQGLDSFQEANVKMQAIRDQLGFDGTSQEFLQKLQTDPRFFAETPEEVGERLMSYMSRMESRIDELFLRTPKAPYGVKRLDPALEGSMTFGYYQWPTVNEPKGHYLYNGSKLDERSLVFAQGLVYHELIPGHHFHIALQFENEDISDFRRQSLHGAYTEGWGEYASWLGVDLGLYDDPYDLYGKYIMDLMLSIRLVVDTGMNYFGWPRSQAAEMMKENLIQSDTEIFTETLRYSVDIPGQALAYKWGVLQILELRRRAKEELGDRFDIRRFHAALLESGSMPISTLEKHIDRFIEQEGR
jgi:uncharacterized protein (DUF885 family)